jgi:hypothetical protein
MANAGSQQVASLLRGFSFDIPFLNAGHVHGRVKRLQLGFVFQCGNSHGALSRRITCSAILAHPAPPEQIDNETLAAD